MNKIRFTLCYSFASWDPCNSRMEPLGPTEQFENCWSNARFDVSNFTTDLRQSGYLSDL